MRTRVSDLECSVIRLGYDMAASHKRLEEMMKSLYHKVDPKQGIAGDDMQAQASSAKFVETLVLISTMAEAKMLPLEPLPPPLLNVVSVMSSSSTLIVCSDVIKDITTDITINVVSDHDNVSKDIATLVKEIVHEDAINAVESDVISDMAEDAVDDAVGQSGVKNNDGHAAADEIVATGDESVVDQVSHTLTH